MVILWSVSHAVRPGLSTVGSANENIHWVCSCVCVCVIFLSVWAERDQWEFVLQYYVLRIYEAMGLQCVIDLIRISQGKSITLTIITVEEPSDGCELFVFIQTNP